MMMRSYVGIGLIILGLVVLFGFGIPKWNDTQAMRDEVNVLRAVKDDVDDAIQIHKDLTERYSKISRESIDRLQKMIPPEAGREQIILILRNIATRNGMDIKELSFSESTQASGGVLQQRLIVEGSYDGFQGFLRDVEKSLRLSNVERISFSSSEDGNFNFTLSLDSYFIDSEIIAKEQ